MKRAFSLVELLIVVAILGIIAAIVLPEFQAQTTQAKEAAAKDNLRILRNAIEIYAAQHSGTPPGYPNGNTAGLPIMIAFIMQLLRVTNAGHQMANPGTPGYPYGPYLSDFPKNPFNGLKNVMMIANDAQLPAEATGNSGWIYKPATKTVRLNWPGTDQQGVRYYDY
jgi:prepilin-type N-terminal cleavage/methylation domain-containing protein